MKRPLVVVYRPVAGAESSYDEIRDSGCDVVVEAVDKPGATLSRAVEQADVLMGATFRGGVMDAQWLDRFARLRLVAKYTIGYDDVDVDAATARGIAVTHCPTEANFGGVAEGAMAMMLAMLKRVRERDRAVKSGGWRDTALEGRYLGAREDGYAGMVIGIVGLGRAGTRLAELLRPWRATLLACDPYVDEAHFRSLGVQRVELDELLQRSDVVTLHCALTSETRGMIDAEKLRQMRRGSLLLNTARGAIVDLEALLDGLESSRPAQAALDVFPSEPLSIGARLGEYGDRLLLSPHMVAANEGGTLLSAVPWATQAVRDALAGIFPQRVVNAEVEPHWRRRFAGEPG